MKVLKFMLFFAAVCAVFLLNGCTRSSEEDEKRIVRWLDDTYGKNSYTIKKDTNNSRYFVINLNAYPDLEILVTIARDVKTGSSYLWTNFDEVFCKYVMDKFEEAYDIGSDKLYYSDSLYFVYAAHVNSLEELKISYDKMMDFINFVSERYPILVDTGALELRMDVDGIRLKGRDDDDKWIYLDIAESKDKTLKIKSYQEIYDELEPLLITHPENPNGLTFHADVGRSFILGSDTLEDCLYKNLVLENTSAEQLENIILQPGETSDPYTLKSESSYEFTKITLQAKNLSDSPAPLFDSIVVKASIDGGKSIYIDPVFIELEYDKRREWIDPYEALGISSPKTEQERKEGVSYKNVKVLFEMNEYYIGVNKVILMFRE